MHVSLVSQKCSHGRLHIKLPSEIKKFATSNAFPDTVKVSSLFTEWGEINTNTNTSKLFYIKLQLQNNNPNLFFDVAKHT